MKSSLQNDLSLLIIRIGSGGMMLTHGLPKINRFFGDGPIKFADPFGLGPEISLALAIFAEVGCALLVIVGFKARIAAIPLMATMLTAALYAHRDDPFGKKELPLLYFLVFLAISIFGSGKYSLDALKKR